MRLMMLLIIFNLLLGCADRPNTDVCIVNAPLLQRKCYNLHDDYDDEGNLKADARPKIRSNKTIADLNKATCLDSPTGFEDGLASMKAYVRTMHDKIEH